LLQETGDAGGPRYAMLDAVREFAREQLGPLADRYEELAAGHFLQRADRDSSSLLTDDQVPALRRLQRELPHVRAGMDWAIRSDRHQSVAHYALCIWPILLYHGLHKECEERLRAGIAAAQQCEDRQ